ncbi:hypothetical protein BCF33_1055 [Hasllibacter halocynthiae]|uniref:Uncharacterized protein n=1 Tax=Hasllibacter halocynthiae TaxID=595589 RepID=A0A2T0X945_9RHOB|nr:hypothetical protein [Hasllibacter halocynthiae]PRY95435.1 hypothetical protein BCF33_1055 [Hasllibacter halocynthiae]
MRPAQPDRLRSRRPGARAPWGRAAGVLALGVAAACQPVPADFVELEVAPPALTGRIPAEARGMPLLADPEGCLYFTAMRTVRPVIDPATEVQVCALR